ncbi:hypothetical protein HAP47_0012205 [Bradyrhizobium sp. 41S5]|uniref:hypothetical protein n=1 Tax=Bradyrhizobium sp. 41S5 TaxID=1404443 RepID=UPI00156B4B7E|nr:hypothetical protein [Bradyrhizobium sp. 41S5]UFX47378.1 hypothetical protein HAP47_0012205 [Bradyrhizobium sp. 41S5]
MTDGGAGVITRGGDGADGGVAAAGTTGAGLYTMIGGGAGGAAGTGAGSGFNVRPLSPPSSRLDAPDTETQDNERQRLESTWTRWPPIENVMPSLAWASGVNSISATSGQKRFIEASKTSDDARGGLLAAQ